MTEEERESLVVMTIAYSGTANGAALDAVAAWAARVLHDYRMLEEVLARRLAVRIIDGVPRFEQCKDQAAENAGA